MSAGEQRALSSYAKGIKAMLNLPATHPQNWFRNSFIHLMDCPHGNWWFFVWHRGYLGYFEQTIRNLSGDNTFAIPYWDWTTLPQIPDSMFNGVLSPQDDAFQPFTKNFGVFTSFIKNALTTYWGNLNPAQRLQLNNRHYTSFDLLWNDVTGLDPSTNEAISGNLSYANTCGSRYLTRDNPKFDAKTTYNTSPLVIENGLKPTEFYNPDIKLSFNSTKTLSHNTAPTNTSFAQLEMFPHNKVHNYIGGVGNVDPGPYGNMTNFLSPVDPIFFLHHANIDRLWDVWTRRQQQRGLPYLPTGNDLTTLANEPFLFYVDGNGKYVFAKAGDFFNTARFDYQYEPGFGEQVIQRILTRKPPRPLIRGAVAGNKASLVVPSNEIQEHLAESDGASLVAEITIPQPSATSVTREYDVLVGAPPDVTSVTADSPYYAGTIAFFGKMPQMQMGRWATVAVPLPKAPQAFRSLTAANATVNIRIVPAQGYGKAPVLKSATIRAL